MNPTSVSFAGNNLQQISSFPMVITSQIDHESLPTKTDTSYPVAHGNSSAIPNVNYPTKKIKLTGNIIASTKQLYEAERDVFLSYFNLTSGNLSIGYNNSTRIYIATADNVKITRDGASPTKGAFEVDFTTNLPFGLDPFITNLYTGSGTAQFFNQTVTFSGSAPWQAPIATFTMQTMSGQTISGIGGQTISFGNSYLGQQASVTRNWSPGDVVVFDSTLNQVTVNGIVTQFAGSLPQFQGLVNGVATPGTFTYSDTFATRSYLYTVQYTARYD